MQKICTSRGTKDETPTKSLKTTDYGNCCIQSVHVEIKRDWIAYTETARKKQPVKLPKTRVITWRLSDARGWGVAGGFFAFTFFSVLYSNPCNALFLCVLLFASGNAHLSLNKIVNTTKITSIATTRTCSPPPCQNKGKNRRFMSVSQKKKFQQSYLCKQVF